MMEKERDIGQDTGELLIFVVLSFCWFRGYSSPTNLHSQQILTFNLYLSWIKMKPNQFSTNL